MHASQKAIAVFDMPYLQVAKIAQQPPRFRRVVPIAVEFGYTPLLLVNVAVTLQNVLLGFSEVLYVIHVSYRRLTPVIADLVSLAP